MIQAPKVFYNFFQFLHQDAFDLYGSTGDQVIATILSFLQRQQRAELVASLNDLLSGGYSERELLDLIHSTDADYKPIGPDAARRFLTGICDAANASLAEGE